ncbi:MAG: carbamoyltransferase N-terminal domain-containing protein [Acidobacteriota bacterium]
MNVLGLSFHYHDAAAALVRDGRVVAAAAEERFSRKKHDSGFPRLATAYCLEEARLLARDLDLVVFYEKPWRKFERILLQHIAAWPRSFPQYRQAIPAWLNRKLWVPYLVTEEIGYRGKVSFVPHHLAHAAAAFFCSPYDEAAILTIDGVGEHTTTAMGAGRGGLVKLTHEVRFPHSLGLLYSAVTAHLGFEVNEGEGKVMGLAPYGTARMKKDFAEVLHVGTDGSFVLDMSYFAFLEKLWMGSAKLEKLFGPARKPGEPLTEHHKDLAASLQATLEDAALALAQAAFRATGSKKLCLAGGVALNCVANGRIAKEGPFEELFVQPASGDDGGALGAALYASYVDLGLPRQDPPGTASLGPEYGADEIALICRAYGVPSRRLTADEIVRETADLIAGEKIVGWFQGRMEFGPRALGNRSILATPKRADMKDVLNARVKHREEFRPYAPAIPIESAPDYFDLRQQSPYMLLAVAVHPERRAEIPAVTHVDGTARVQTVNEAEHPLYYRLLKELGRITGTPVVLDTSFNVKGEPVVCAPEHALDCFLGTEIDALVLGDHLILKEQCRPAIASPVAAAEAVRP